MRAAATAIIVGVVLGVLAPEASATCNGAVAQACVTQYHFAPTLFWTSRVPYSYTNTNFNTICSNLQAAEACVLAAGCALTDMWNDTEPGKKAVQPFGNSWSVIYSIYSYTCGAGKPAFLRNLVQCFQNHQFYGYTLDAVYTGGLCLEPTNGTNCTQVDAYYDCLLYTVNQDCGTDSAAFFGQIVAIYLSQPYNWLTVQINTAVCPLTNMFTTNCACGPNPQGCYDCDKEGGACLNPAQQYYMANSSCYPCTPHCLTCNAAPPGCDVGQCMTGYTLDNVTGMCNPICAGNCSYCKVPYTCITCDAGFGLSPPSVASCTPCTTTYCDQCNAAYKTCTLCVTGFDLSTVSGVTYCTVDPAHCALFTLFPNQEASPSLTTNEPSFTTEAECIKGCLDSLTCQTADFWTGGCTFGAAAADMDVSEGWDHWVLQKQCELPCVQWTLYPDYYQPATSYMSAFLTEETCMIGCVAAGLSNCAVVDYYYETNDCYWGTAAYPMLDMNDTNHWVLNTTCPIPTPCEEWAEFPAVQQATGMTLNPAQKTLTGCQAACVADTACMVVDFDATTKACYMGDAAGPVKAATAYNDYVLDRQCVGGSIQSTTPTSPTTKFTGRTTKFTGSTTKSTTKSTGPTTSPKPSPVVARPKWHANPPSKPSPVINHPVQYVVIHQTFTIPCTTEPGCLILIKKLQAQQMTQRGRSDIAYNYLIGEDGNIYEGVGAGFAGQAMNSTAWNNKALSIGFLGTFKQGIPNKAAYNAAQTLFAYLIPKYLNANYYLNGHYDIECTLCPGGDFEASLVKWPQYNQAQHIICSPGSRGWLHVMK